MNPMLSVENKRNAILRQQPEISYSFQRVLAFNVPCKGQLGAGLDEIHIFSATILPQLSQPSHPSPAATCPVQERWSSSYVLV